MGTLNNWISTTKTTKPNNGKYMTLFERSIFFGEFSMSWLNTWTILVPSKTQRRQRRFYHLPHKTNVE